MGTNGLTGTVHRDNQVSPGRNMLVIFGLLAKIKCPPPPSPLPSQTPPPKQFNTKQNKDLLKLKFAM